MAFVDFNRGELSPNMRYRSDLAAQHRGVERMENMLPTPRGGLVRRPGSQVLELLPPSEQAPAVRIFSLGSTGLDYDIVAPGTDTTVEIGDAIYDTEFRTHNIPKNVEMEILLSFTEYGDADDIVAYWINTPNGVPAFYQRIWTYLSSLFSFPSIDFNDTRDVRVTQVQNNVYIIARTHIYRLFWERDKTVPAWSNIRAYNERDVVSLAVEDKTYYFECKEANTANNPSSATGPLFWRVVYMPSLSWEIVSPRVGHELLTGIGTDEDMYRWVSNATWASNTKYYKGDVVIVSTNAYECIEEHITGTVGSYKPTGDTQAWDAYWILLGSDPDPEAITELQKIYQRSSYAFREETVPREMVVHHNRLIFASSSIRPSTIHGSEVYHYMDFGAGINDDEPWIVTLSGDLVGRILWMTVTDQLYIGTSGGIYAVSGVITPTAFQLRKVTSHATSEIHAVAAAGSVIFFHKDKKTLREIEYADQAENYRAFDLTVYSNHLFETYKAIKLVVVNDPMIIIWILREDGTLVSLSYEKTVDMYAFARHQLHGQLWDIVAGKNGELYGVLELPNSGVRQLLRIGPTKLIGDEDETSTIVSDLKLDGLVSMVNLDNSNLFATQVVNDSMRSWFEGNGITSIEDMFDWVIEIDASDQDITGLISECGLNYLDEIPSIDLSGNSLEGAVPSNLGNLMSNAVGGSASLNLSGNPLTIWDIEEIPGTWVDINLSDTSFSPGQCTLIVESVIQSLSVAPRVGVLNLNGLGLLGANDALPKLITLKAAGWTVLIDNQDGWESEYIAFNGNGNTSGDVADPIPCMYMGSVTIPDKGTLAKTNYEFFGWAGSSDAQSATHSAGNIYIKDVEGNKTFYAVWVPDNEVVYNANGGSGTIPVDSVTYNPGDIVAIKSSALSRYGYTFRGWTTDAAGTGTLYNTGDTFVMGSAAVMLYAKWTINQYTLTFNVNGAQYGAAPSARTQDYNTTYAIPSNPSALHRYVSTAHTNDDGTIGYHNEFKRFRRWNTAADGSGTPYNTGAIFTYPGYSVTLYAEYIDYSVGDLNAWGDKIFKVFPNYAKRTYFSRSTSADNQWIRYLSPKIISSPGDVTGNPTKNEYASGVDTFHLFNEEYLREMLTNGVITGFASSEYWVGAVDIRMVEFLVWKTYYFYMNMSGAVSETTNTNLVKGYIEGRAF